jgi:predicted permease
MQEITPDWHVFVFTACVSFVVGIVFGLTPMLQVNRLDVNGTLKASGRNSEGATGIRTRRALVASQVALSLLLLVTAGLLIRSFVKLQAVSAGVDDRNTLSVQVSLPATRYAQPEIVDRFVDSLVQNVSRLPGVESASVGSILPLSGANTRADFSIAGRPPVKEEERPAAQNRWITPGYFRSLGIPLIAGRDFTDFDNATAQPVVVIDDALAKRFLPDVNPIGAHLRVSDSGPDARDVEIVGIVGNVKHFSLDEPPTATYYSPLAQVPPQSLRFLINGMILIVRTKADPLALADRVRREMRSLDNEVPASAVRTVDQLLAAAVAPRRFNLVLIEIFAAAALVLAAMGLYSVIAYTVIQRRQEIGIRIALGASARDVFGQVLREGMLLTIVGEAAGLAVALATTRFLSGLLFEITPTDPVTFVAISVILSVTAFIACYIPARRVVSVDPTLALRNE